MNPFGSFHTGPDPATQRRLSALEADRDKHRKALEKTNSLLKECINRIQKLEAERASS